MIPTDKPLDVILKELKQEQDDDTLSLAVVAFATKRGDGTRIVLFAGDNQFLALAGLSSLIHATVMKIDINQKDMTFRP